MLNVLLFGITGCSQQTAVQSTTTTPSDDLAAIAHAFKYQHNGIFVQGSGFVGRVLDDDLAPPRHQKFLVRLANGQTLLIAHNIDIASRIDDLKTSDYIAFRGQYEWSEKGGTVHMTHRDPSGRFSGGWIEYNGKRYE